MYGGFSLVAAGLFHAFLRARSGRRAAWIATAVVLAVMTALGCALAAFVLPALRAIGTDAGG